MAHEHKPKDNKQSPWNPKKGKLSKKLKQPKESKEHRKFNTRSTLTFHIMNFPF
jgi:hypothetical protein